MVHRKQPKLYNHVLQAVSKIGDVKGSSARTIVELVRTAVDDNKDSQPKLRSVTMQVRSALKHGMERGYIQHRAGRYKLKNIADLAKNLCGIPSNEIPTTAPITEAARTEKTNRTNWCSTCGHRIARQDKNKKSSAAAAQEHKKNGRTDRHDTRKRYKPTLKETRDGKKGLKRRSDKKRSKRIANDKRKHSRGKIATKKRSDTPHPYPNICPSLVDASPDSTNMSFDHHLERKRLKRRDHVPYTLLNPEPMIDPPENENNLLPDDGSEMNANVDSPKESVEENDGEEAATPQVDEILPDDIKEEDKNDDAIVDTSYIS